MSFEDDIPVLDQQPDLNDILNEVRERVCTCIVRVLPYTHRKCQLASPYKQVYVTNNVLTFIRLVYNMTLELTSHQETLDYSLMTLFSIASAF